MDKERIKCGCKINLRLKIFDKRDDGYHNLETIFYPVSDPHDLLEIRHVQCEGEVCALGFHDKAEDELLSRIRIVCDVDGIDPKNNTLTKAYVLYAQKTGFAPHLFIELTKGIPHGAGLGGGSSDAASLLLYLQEKHANPLTMEELVLLAAKVGADVPFFLWNIPCMATGIGEKLEKISLDIKDFYLVLINPYIHVSTGMAFSSLAEQKKCLTVTQDFDKSQSSHSERESQEKSFEEIDFQSDFWENDFEQVILEKYPLIGNLKNILLEAGAELALLSGSGSCLFGIFRNLREARMSKEILEERFGGEKLNVYDPIILG